jgi:hypothetical protein
MTLIFMLQRAYHEGELAPALSRVGVCPNNLG